MIDIHGDGLRRGVVRFGARSNASDLNAIVKQFRSDVLPVIPRSKWREAAANFAGEKGVDAGDLWYALMIVTPAAAAIGANSVARGNS